jgi:hypothetical protein
MAGRYSTAVRIVVPRDTVLMGGHGEDPEPGTAAGDVVYQLWRSVTGRELFPAARQEFASRAAALSLAEVDEPELTAAARRVFGVSGKLLLADWREEIDEPGLAGLRAVSGEWEGDTESAALTLRTEIAHLIESALSARDQRRPVLRRRLGLDGEQGLTLAALGAEYGLSRERIRQLQVRQLAQLAARARRSRRGAVLREVFRGLADRGGESRGAALDEIAGLVFPEAGSDLRLHTVAVLARYPAQVRAQLAAQAAQARDLLGRPPTPVRMRLAELRRRRYTGVRPDLAEPGPHSQSPRSKETSVDQLERQFHRAMVEIYETAKRELSYNATRFPQMLSERGGLATARQLLWSDTPSEGFTTLWSHHRLDLTVEAHVLQEKFADLFTDADRQRARERLEAYGWHEESG